jgi:hypothetical protein
MLTAPRSYDRGYLHTWLPDLTIEATYTRLPDLTIEATYTWPPS